MPKIDRLSGRSDWVDLSFVERERTPCRLMELGIRLHLAGLSLSNTVRELEKFGVDRSRKAVYDWIQKADLQPATDADPNHVALDETVIRINDHQYWLYAAVDPETNRILHIRLFSTTTTALTERFLRELIEKHDVENAVFLVDGAQHLQTALRRRGLRFRYEKHGNRNAVERIFREIKRRTTSFSNCFSHVRPSTAESWLQAFAVWQNATN
ncbi:Transposase (or an inactivated derivative) [Halobiforma haloterrestris]|uniref:Transposase (Or an inactivated derivative) n=1 Tax=Natronobacterium haloterrestre TaxID=148448 RepID=A0A1I1KHJ2_NATHA|nr:IS6 family transposase [Halobiforma haloterrestris]SFC60035.1 Transposase (or an inactivated derivative) [Halobiforma haloterrestris]